MRGPVGQAKKRPRRVWRGEFITGTRLKQIDRDLGRCGTEQPVPAAGNSLSLYNRTVESTLSQSGSRQYPCLCCQRNEEEDPQQRGKLSGRKTGAAKRRSSTSAARSRSIASLRRPTRAWPWS